MVGFEKLKENFKRLVDSEQLSHAYLFFGGDKKTHQEKFIFSLSLANFLESGIFEEPKIILNETLIISPDEKGTIGIDGIRMLKYFLWQKPISSSRRIVIIKEAQSLTPEAQNAALKIVEEPPESALIIFIADSEDDLFAVLTSRVQKIYFSSKTRMDTDKKTDGYRCNSIRVDPFSYPCESVLSEAEIDGFFKDLISDLNKAPLKNSQQLKAVLNTLTTMKQFNTNKRLQLKSLISLIANN